METVEVASAEHEPWWKPLVALWISSWEKHLHAGLFSGWASSRGSGSSSFLFLRPNLNSRSMLLTPIPLPEEDEASAFDGYFAVRSFAFRGMLQGSIDEEVGSCHCRFLELCFVSRSSHCCFGSEESYKLRGFNGGRWRLVVNSTRPILRRKVLKFQLSQRNSHPSSEEEEGTNSQDRTTRPRISLCTFTLLLTDVIRHVVFELRVRIWSTWLSQG